MTLEAGARHRAESADLARPDVAVPDVAVPNTAELHAIVGDAIAEPTTGGWAAAATAVHAIRLVAAPVVLRLVVADHATILIDVRYRAYRWGLPLGLFPVDVDSVIVHTKPLEPDAAPLFDLPGEDLDALLWTMGLHAFGDEPAGWMRPGDRHRLSRWPNFTALAHDPEQLRMTALLGNAYLTADELARAAGTSQGEAQRLLNALGLMDSLRSSGGDVAPPPAFREQPVDEASDEEPARRRGLFGRLREKLGR